MLRVLLQSAGEMVYLYSGTKQGICWEGFAPFPRNGAATPTASGCQRLPGLTPPFATIDSE